MLIHKRFPWLVTFSLALLTFAICSAAQQKISKADLTRAQAVLRQVREIIGKNYYDPAFSGYDLDSRFQKADEQFADVSSFEMAMTVVGWAVQGLADSHTNFIPPLRNVVVYNGWRIEMIGQTCVISAVEPKSDAWKQGLRPGDVVQKVDNYQPTRATLGQIRYILSTLAPLAQNQFVVASPCQPSRVVIAQSRLINIPLTDMTVSTTRKELHRMAEGNWDLYKTRAVEINEKLMISVKMAVEAKTICSGCLAVFSTTI
jgi:hypothetical protein